MSENSLFPRRAEPANAGVSAVGVAEFIKALERSKAHMRGFILLRHGKTAAERYWEPYTAEDKNWVYSLSKSFTSTAVGFAFDDGLLHPDDLALSFFPEIDPSSCSENARKMRLRDLLSMTSGHADDPSVKVMFSPPSDWEKLFFQLPVPKEPGTYYVYNSAASYILSSVVARVTKMKTLDFLTDRLFDPLGFSDVAGDSTPGGVFTGGWGLMVRLEDLAKLGQLYLDGGVWNGKRILSGEWVQMASAVQSDNGAPHRANEPPDWRQGYGFQFWRCRHNCFRGDGAAGQYCIIMPDYGAVLALMSETPDMQEILDIVWDVLLPAMDGISSPREADLNGAAIELDRHAGAEQAVFTFTEDTLTLTIRGNGESCTLESGRGFYKECICALPVGEPAFTPFYTVSPEKRVSSHFKWSDTDTLEVFWVYRETPHRERLVCRFEGDKVNFTLHSSVHAKKNEDDVDFTGKIITL